MTKLRKRNPNAPSPTTQKETQAGEAAQKPTQNENDNVLAPAQISRGRSTSFTEPVRHPEPLRSHRPCSPTPYPVARNPDEDATGASESASEGNASDEKHALEIPQDHNADMYSGKCWCCGSMLVRVGLGEECVECWADQIVY